MRFLFFIILFLGSLVCNARQITTANLAQFRSETGVYTIPAGDVVYLTADFLIKSGESLNIYGELILGNPAGSSTKLKLTNEGSVVVHDGAKLATYNLTNGGIVAFEENATLSISNNLTSGVGGTFTLAENQSVVVKYVTYNGGTVAGPKSSMITVTEKMANNGVLEIGDDFNIDVSGILENRGVVNVNADLSISGSLTNNNGKNITVSSGSSLTVAKTLTNNSSGTISVSSGSSLITSTSFTNNGTVAIAENANVNISGDVTNNSSGTISVSSGSFLTVAKTLSNNGTVDIAENANVNISGVVTNSGTISASSGSFLTVAKSFTNNGTVDIAENTNVNISGALTNSGTISASSGSSLTTSTNFTNNGTVDIAENTNVNISGALTNNGTISASSGSSLTVAKTLTNSGTVTVIDNAKVTVSSDLTNNSGGSILIGDGTLEAFNFCNMGDVSVVSITDFASLHIKNQFYNIDKNERHNTSYTGPQGRVYLSNSLFQVDEKLWVGEDQTHLVDRGIIVDGDKDTYILVNDMVHTSVGKNWLTVKNNSELYIITDIEKDYTGIDPGTAATGFKDDNKVWEFVEVKGQRKDAIFVEGDYTYYKMEEGKDIAGMGNGNKPNLYLKVPNNIHISGGIHAGGYHDMNHPENDKTIGVLNKESNEIWRNTISSLLPVELETFEVTLSNNTVDFYWATASEKNAKHFETQVSFDGIHFNTMQKVEANGTTSERHIYSTSVSSEKFPSGVIYFRLKIVDNDASYQYSNVVSGVLDSNAETLTVYPNPASEYITISGNFKSAVVVDRSGRNVAVQPMSANMLNVAGLSVGAYYVVVTTDNGKTVLPFVKE